MKINYHFQKLRKERTRDQWIRIATDFNAGIPVEMIRNRYLKSNGKKYARGSIYLILKKVATLKNSLPVKGGEVS